MARCRASQGAPFFGEVGIDPLAKPGLVAAPAQALLQQDLIDAAALHRDPLVLGQVGRQPIQRPAGERQLQGRGIGERSGDHGGTHIGRVGGRAARARLVLQSRKPLCVEAADAATHGLGAQPERVGNGGRRFALAGMPDDAGALDTTRGCFAQAGQVVHRCSFFSAQVAQANRGTTHGISPAEQRSPVYHLTCRMNHLVVHPAS